MFKKFLKNLCTIDQAAEMRRIEKNQRHVSAAWERMIQKTNEKKWHEAEKLFNEIRDYAKSHTMAFMDLHLLYANYLVNQSEFERSLPHLNFLKGIYQQVGITDETFLAIRNIPSFEEFVVVAKNYLMLNKTQATDRGILQDLTGKVDSQGRALILQALADLDQAATDS